MTSAKEKAQQLIYAFEAFTDRDNEYEFAKQCAAIAVDEILEMIDDGEIDVWNRDILIYWQEVKQEIENL